MPAKEYILILLLLLFGAGGLATVWSLFSVIFALSKYSTGRWALVLTTSLLFALSVIFSLIGYVALLVAAAAYYAQMIAASWFVTAGSPIRAKVFLGTSLSLAMLSLWVANSLNYFKGSDFLLLLAAATPIAWLGCAITAIGQCKETGALRITTCSEHPIDEVPDAVVATVKRERHTATILWTLASLGWAIILLGFCLMSEG